MPETVIQSTRIYDETETSRTVELVIADSADPESAREYFSIRALVNCQGHWSLAAIQRATLERMRDVIGAEIQRTRDIANRRDD